MLTPQEYLLLAMLLYSNLWLVYKCKCSQMQHSGISSMFSKAFNQIYRLMDIRLSSYLQAQVSK